MIKKSIGPLFFIASALVLSSCGQLKREVSSTELTEEISDILLRVEWKKAAQNLSQCSSLLTKSYEEINDLNTDRFSVGKVSKEKLDQLVQESFKLRLDIKASLESYKAEKDCLNALLILIVHFAI